MTVDLSGPHKDQTPAQMRSNIIAAVGGTLKEFTYRNDTSDNRNYYVRVQTMAGSGLSGEDERGEINLMLVEI